MVVAQRSGLEAMWQELLVMANAQYVSPESKRLLAVPMTKARARHWSVQLAKFTMNRRDCWAYVQGAAPLDVKKIIWAHEEEELIGEQDKGKLDHYALAIKEGALLGLKEEDFEQTPLIEGGLVCFYAWTHIAKDRPWLEALAASAVLEIRNSEEFVRGGAMSKRRGEKWAAELGIPMKEQVYNAEHVVADVEHAHMLMEVATKHALTEADQQAILRGARESLIIDRIFWGHLADSMLAIEE